MQYKYFPTVLLCGYERGGTTLLSEIFRHNGYESGFECGVLMCEKPSDFSQLMPYAKMIKAGWELDNNIDTYIPENDHFMDFYHNIITASGLSNRTKKFFDKTPVYMKEIGKCLNKAAFIEKAIVITRDPRAIFASWAKRNKDSQNMSIESVVKKNLKIYSKRYNRYFAGAIAERDNPKVMFVSYESLCVSPLDTYQSIGYFVEKSAFSALNKVSRFKNVYDASVKINKVNEFDKLLSNKLQKKVLEACAVSALFFSSNNEKIKYFSQFKALDESIRMVLNEYDLSACTINIDGRHFNPWLYLYLNRRLLKSGENPVSHFKRVGIRDNLPY